MTEPQAETATKATHRKTKAAIDKKNNILETLSVEYWKIGDIKPNSYNPNRQSEHDFELLCRSMKEDGFTQPIIVQKSTGIIVDGEHRWRAAAKLGFDEIPVAPVDMTDEQAKIATLRHNRARGSEDIELSAQVLRDLRQLGALDWAQDSLMLSDTELDRLLDDVPAPEALAGEEFSEAWAPGETVQDGEIKGALGTREVSMTPEAIEQVREQERKIADAKTEEERVQAQKETDIFRIACVFTGEQAKTVKAVLGDKPAVKLLELCETAYDTSN